MERFDPVCRFQLFVAGDTPNSVEALGNLTRLCNEYLPGRHEIDVVDVFREPTRALAEGILMTPTLIRLAPASTIRIVGTLGNAQVTFQALGLQRVGP
ncbi:MAG: circadian clock KaiB family protein [Polaromonas sp.]